MKAKHVDWTTETLQSPTIGIKHKWVEVTGWLLFDLKHIHEAENTYPGNLKNWRATCWEIHPVTNLVVLGGPPPGTHLLHPDLLMALQSAHSQQLERDPKRKESLINRHKQILSKFDKE